MGTYSVIYLSSRYSCENAIDWDWEIKGEWASSEKEGSRWFSQRGLDTEAYKALLKHFGLEKWAREFPPERIISISPRELAKVRKRKEEEHRLPRKVTASDALGYHILAENHGSERR